MSNNKWTISGEDDISIKKYEGFKLGKWKRKL